MLHTTKMINQRKHISACLNENTNFPQQSIVFWTGERLCWLFVIEFPFVWAILSYYSVCCVRPLPISEGTSQFCRTHNNHISGCRRFWEVQTETNIYIYITLIMKIYSIQCRTASKTIWGSFCVCGRKKALLFYCMLTLQCEIVFTFFGWRLKWIELINNIRYAK